MSRFFQDPIRIPLAVLSLAIGLLGGAPSIALQNPSQFASSSAATMPRAMSEMERQGRDLDRRLTAELEQSDPEAARLFTQANEARDRADHATAYLLYGQVYDRVPSFAHALRRQVIVNPPNHSPAHAGSISAQFEHPPLAPHPVYGTSMVEIERRLRPRGAAGIGQIELITSKALRHERRLMLPDYVFGQKGQLLKIFRCER